MRASIAIPVFFLSATALLAEAVPICNGYQGRAVFSDAPDLFRWVEVPAAPAPETKAYPNTTPASVPEPAGLLLAALGLLGLALSRLRLPPSPQ